MQYETVIGLEVHLHLATKSKAFCGCSTEFGAQPNTHTCPVCLGFPGSLPVLNELALEYAIRCALALNCQVQNFIKFDRKNYFYPDLPKNYQISQYDMPLSLNGFLDIETDGKIKRVSIRRVHLEEDAGKLIHQKEASLLDYNRAGIPLLEIVSEPDINSPSEAYEYLSSLKSILKYLEVSDCDMEKGSLRCDANISLRKFGQKTLGVKTELKNMNSFKAVRAALEFELKRQKASLEKQKRIIQETRLWDNELGQTLPMRTKEGASDYRYFPEPDLVPFTVKDDFIAKIKDTLPELPEARIQRFKIEYGLSDYDTKILVGDKALADFFEQCSKLYKSAKILSNWITGAVLAELNARNKTAPELISKIKPRDICDLLSLVDQGKLSNLMAKDILKDMFDTGACPDAIISGKGFSLVSTEVELVPVIDEVVKENAKSVQDYKSGRVNAIMFLLGQVMHKTEGKANPKVVKEILAKRLKEEGDV